MRLIIIFLLFSFSMFSQSGIEPSSFQGTPYEGGILVGVTPIVDEFTGDTIYLYQHSEDYCIVIDSLVFTDSLRLYTSEGVFTTYIASGGGGGGSGTVTSIATTLPITGGTITTSGTIGINTANGSQSGAISSTDWTTFNNKIGGTGTTNYLSYFSGASTLSDSPIYRLSSNSISLGTTSNTNLLGRSGINLMDTDPAFVLGKSTSNYWYYYMNGNNFELYNPNFGAVALWQTDGKLKMGKYAGSGNRYLYASSTGEINVSLYDAASTSGTGTNGYVPRYFNSSILDRTGLYCTADFGNNFGIGTTSPATYGITSGGGIAIYNATDPRFSLGNSSGYWLNYLSTSSYKLFNNTFGDVMEYTNTGRVGINKTSPSTRLHIGGDLMVDVRTGTATTMTGFDPDGKVVTLGLGAGLSITGGDLISTATGITSLGGETGATQTFATGTTGTDFNISSASNVHTFNLPTASSVNTGKLSSADWITFNNKGNGTVTNFSAGDLSPLFITTEATTTTTPALSFLPVSQTANLFYASPNGSSGNPAFRSIVAADVPTLNQNTTGSAATLTTGRTISMTGDVSYTSGSFNGSANVTGTGTLATVNANVGTFTNATVTVNAKGLITAASSGSGSGITSLGGQTGATQTFATANTGTYPSWSSASNVHTYRLPSASTGQVLKYDGTGWAAGTDNGGVSGSGTATQLAFWNSGSNITSDNNMYWDNSNKRLGLGTNTSPLTALHITSLGSMGNGILMQNANAMSNGLISQHLLSIGTGTGFSSTNRYYALKNIMTSSTTADYRVAYWNGTTEVDRLTLTDGGLFGIGVSPSRTLDVNGELRIRDLVTTNATSLLGSDANGDVSSVGLSGLSLSSGTLTATDPSITNEGYLGVTVGSSNSSVLQGYNSNGTATGAGMTLNGNFMQYLTESPSTNGGSITMNAAAPYTLLAVNSLTHNLTTSYSKMALDGGSSWNGDALYVNFDNANDEIDVLTSGTYKVSYTCNCKSNTAAHTVNFNILNTSTLGSQGTETSHYFASTTEFCHNNMYWILPLTAGNSFGLYAKTSTGTPNINDCNIRFMIERLK